jgi:hypothetical protein
VPPRAVADATQEAHRASLSLAGSRRLRGLGGLGHGGPDEPHQFSGHRSHGDRWPLPVPHEMTIAAMQALLRAPGVAEARGRLPMASAGQGPTEDGTVAIVPGRFHQHAPRVRVAGLGQGTPTLALARGVLAGDQPQVGHERSRPLEAAEVPDLREQNHRGQRVDAAKAAQPPHRLSSGRGLGQGLDLAIQLDQADERLLEGEERDLERALEGGDFEALAAEPRPVALRPVPTREVPPPVPIEEFHDAMLPAEHIPPHVLAAAQEVTHAFVRFLWHVNGGQFAGPEQPDQLPGIALVGLDPLAGALTWQRTPRPVI